MTEDMHVWLLTDYVNPGPPTAWSSKEKAMSQVESLEPTLFEGDHGDWQQSEDDNERYYVQPKWEEHPMYVVERVEFMDPEGLLNYDD